MARQLGADIKVPARPRRTSKGFVWLDPRHANILFAEGNRPEANIRFEGSPASTEEIKTGSNNRKAEAVYSGTDWKKKSHQYQPAARPAASNAEAPDLLAPSAEAPKAPSA